MESHRRDITVVFCDLRGFTAFSESAEPEDIIAVLQDYYRCLGESIDRFEGTLQHFAGDGLLIFFNDPIPCPDPSVRAVRMAVEMRDRIAGTCRKNGADWVISSDLASALRPVTPRLVMSAMKAACIIRHMAPW